MDKRRIRYPPEGYWITCKLCTSISRRNINYANSIDYNINKLLIISVTTCEVDRICRIAEHFVRLVSQLWDPVRLNATKPRKSKVRVTAPAIQCDTHFALFFHSQLERNLYSLRANKSQQKLMQKCFNMHAEAKFETGTTASETEQNGALNWPISVEHGNLRRWHNQTFRIAQHNFNNPGTQTSNNIATEKKKITRLG